MCACTCTHMYTYMCRHVRGKVLVPCHTWSMRETGRFTEGVQGPPDTSGTLGLHQKARRLLQTSTEGPGMARHQPECWPPHPNNSRRGLGRSTAKPETQTFFEVKESELLGLSNMTLSISC